MGKAEPNQTAQAAQDAPATPAPTTVVGEPAPGQGAQPSEQDAAADATLLSKGAKPPAEPPTDEPEQETPSEPEVPETYEFTAPDGEKLDPVVVAAYSGIAKELKLSQDGAQKILDTMTPVLAARQQAAVVETVKGWRDAVQKDPEIGGRHLDGAIADANRAVAKFGSNTLREVLEKSRLGDHPEVIRFLAKVGKAVAEDTPGTGRPAARQKTLAETIYPDLNP